MTRCMKKALLSSVEYNVLRILHNKSSKNRCIVVIILSTIPKGTMIRPSSLFCDETMLLNGKKSVKKGRNPNFGQNFFIGSLY